MKRFLVVLLVVILGLAAVNSSAYAQDPTPEPTATQTPTPTATPANLQAVQLNSGNTLIIDRTITYGDIAIVVVVVLLLACIVILAIMVLPRVYL